MPILLEKNAVRMNLIELRKRRLVRFSCLAVLSLQPLLQASYASGQAAHPTDRMLSGQAAQAGAISPTLMVGDLVDLEVFDTPELTAPKLRIDQDGTIAVPVVGNVKVAGLTPLQANAAVEQRLRDAQIMTNPSVMILVLEYATGGGVDVIGEVRAPGIYSFLGPHTLYDALAAAGGPAATAGSTITVTHRDDPTHPLIIRVGSPEYNDLRTTTVVQSGDVVEVSHSNTFYVVGDVGHSGEFVLTSGARLTALNALALGGGPTKTSKLGSASIVRMTPAGVKSIPVNLRQVERASADDPMLLPGDVLVVPTSFPRAFFNIFIPNAASAVAAAVTYSYLR